MTTHATHAPETTGGAPVGPRPGAARPRTRRWLVAWFRWPLGGGIGRFLNVARTVGRFGHRVDFLSLSGETASDWPDFPGRILTWEESAGQSWDAVMVPGAGEPIERLEQLTVLRDPRFGLRVQHVLSDPSVQEGFRAVNRALDPDLVIVNNGQWQPRDFRTLEARAFHILPGAVDTDLFYPEPFRASPASPPGWAIGVHAGRDLEPILQAVALLPAGCVLHLYGGVPARLAEPVRTLLESGRVEVHGILGSGELADFHRRMDLVVAVQSRAGWCNPAAEAMASGLPCVVARHGTVDFARHLENAIVVNAIDPTSIADAVERLIEDAPLRTGLARRAAATMRGFGWNAYCERLLSILAVPPVRSYYRIPELGLYGKWEPEVRIKGLEWLVERCQGAHVLDLGAAEGIVGWVFARNGAERVHGLELDADRVWYAQEVLAPGAGADCVYRQADLSDWTRVVAEHQDLLLDGYDIVLFLGIYHHLPADARRLALLGAASRSRRWLALRTVRPLVTDDRVVELMARQGFELVQEAAESVAEGLGWLGIFERRGGPAE